MGSVMKALSGRLKLSLSDKFCPGNNTCSGNGDCDKSSGLCSCKPEYYGQGCECKLLRMKLSVKLRICTQTQGIPLRLWFPTGHTRVPWRGAWGAFQ